MPAKIKRRIMAMVALLVIIVIVIIILAATDKKELAREQIGDTIIGEIAEAVAKGEPLPSAESETVEEVQEDAEPTSVDLPNEKEMRLYVDGGGVMELVTEYTSYWDPDYDIAIFEAINSDEQSIYYDDYFMLHQNYWESVDSAVEYKIGYELNFDVDGEHKTITILSPSDILNNDDLFMGDAANDVVTGYMGVWVYCDMYQTGTYIHLMPEDMSEGTLMTSIKLRPTPQSSAVSNFKLKVYSYSSDQEFNSKGQYIGTHGYEIPVNNQ